jgi:class 3 adenylate cyclase
MLPAPEVRFTRSGDLSLAYVTYGAGPLDTVFVSPLMSHVEVMTEPPQLSQIWSRLAGLGRLILFDRRGAGLSDPAPGFDGASLDAWSDDLEAVLAAVGAEAVCLFTFDTGAAYSLMFAASHPERVRSMALIQPWVPNAGAAGGEEYAALASATCRRSWGEDTVVQGLSPVLAADGASAAWWARFERMSMSRSTASRDVGDFYRLDVTSAAPFVHAPVLIMHSTALESPATAIGVELDSTAWLRDHLENVELAEVTHTDLHWWWDPDLRALMLDAVNTHFTGRPASPDTDRVLATVLFTDLVGSTQKAAALGDKRWQHILDEHDALIIRELDAHRGVLVNSTGDGVVATFDAPARALRCARAIRAQLQTLKLDTRVGVHTGEVQRRGTDIAGLAVHVAARITAHANDGEILVSRTVRDLVVGSGLVFAERGEHNLKGVPESWQLFALVE